MIIQPSHVTETVSVTPLDPYVERSSIACLDFVSTKRFKQGVNLKPCLMPVAFRETLTCYNDPRQKRFKSQTLYEARIVPRLFSDALTVYPKKPSKTFVACLEYHMDECKRWFKTTVDIKAFKYTTCKIISSDELSSSGVITGDEYSSSGEDCSIDDEYKALIVRDGPGASQVFIPRWNKEGLYEQNNNLATVYKTRDIILNGY